MNPLEIPSYTRAVTSSIAARNSLQITQNTSYLARRLSDELRGGKRANPDLPRAIAVADDLNAHLLEAQHRWPHLQKQRELPTARADVLQSGDLPTIVGAASSDARYVQRLTAGGMGMSVNVVEPLRVLRELRRKLAFIQDHWPDLQADDVDRGGGNVRDEKILQQLIESGEVRL